MKKYLLLFLSPFCMMAQVPAGYYNGTENLEGYALKEKLHQIIAHNTISWNYSDLPDYMETLDADKYYDADGSLMDLYTKFPGGGSIYRYFKDDLISTAGAEGEGYNREHVMPQSTFYSDYPMQADLFYIFPSDAYINQRRSNNPYGLVGSADYNFTNGTKIGESITPGKTGRVLEPIDEFKGDIARMLLYFIVRYEGKLHFFAYDKSPNPLGGTEELGFESWYINQLIQWSNQDPVSQYERDRNEDIYALQQNRNPFIDHPEWVDKIWNATLTTTTPSQVAGVTAIDTGAHFIRLSWDAASNALGYKVTLNGRQITTTHATHYDIGHLEPSTTYTVGVSAYNEVYTSSPVSTLSVTTLATDNFAEDLMFTKYVEGSGYNKALEITNNTGHDVDLTKYRVTKQAVGYKNNGDPYYYFTGAYQLEGILEKGEAMVLMNPKANFSGYNMNDAEVKTNANALNFSGYQYIELNYDNTKESGYKYPKTIDAIGYFGQKDNYAKNISLYRNPEVKNPNYRYDPTEWTTHPQNYIVGLGEGTLATDEVKPHAEIKIYPNPVLHDEIHVEGAALSKIKSLKIFDASGHLVKHISAPFEGNSISIKLSELPSGWYVLQAADQSFKFIKK